MAQHQFPQQDQYPFNLGDLSPGSPDSITMSGLGRPADVGMPPFAQYGQGAPELLDVLQAFASGHGQQGFTQTQALHPTMSQFMHDRGPWNPLGVARQSAGVSFSQALPNFTGYRSIPPPSEADTVSQSVGGIPTDSGYGSNARQSVGNPSVYGEVDQSLETRSLISRLQAMGQDDISSKEEPRNREARSQRPALGTPNAKSIICPVCNVPVKTNSELNSSAADHASFGPSDAAPSDAAMAASSNPDSEPSWGGMDQAHVAPAHLINGLAHAGNMVPYSGLPSTDERDITSLGAGVLSHAHTKAKAFGPFDAQAQPREVVHLDADDTPDMVQEDDQSEADEVESSVPDEMDVDDSVQDSASEDGLHDTDAEEDEPSDSTTDIQSNLLRDTGAQYTKADEVHIKASPSQVRLGVDTPQPIDLDDETQASAVIQSLIKKGKLGEMLKKFGYQAPEEAETKEQKAPVASSIASDGGRINKCQECHKTFQRRCELKKHLKRHAKPYACTFAKCDKKFGSKNDWKRHENSQHFQLEIWRCAEKTADRPDQPECGKVCHRRESLKSHLEKDHGIHGHAVLDKKLADCRMGRNFELRFWCGFCQKTIEPTGKGGPAHSERFDHIDDHFNGRGVPKADIKDWKHVDTDPVDSPANSPGKGRRPKWVPVARTGKSRKRVYSGGGDDGASRAKRFKDGNGKVFFWTCCFCNNYWRMGTTVQCMGGCDHAFCGNCKVFDNEDTGEPEVPGQDAGQDGLMT
ncbi:hypothetical protein C8A01DRAFT_40122 [Parachaetomium inaequale]|uniref:C2H2-type domain-containing protein n=1 Tax=Parachaetomium inaequale TaxID=2588326 RepID=A0AAN6P9Q8_9PEZI|nr:hypothetical protein C8A01DRAFT_40122 [Parachaetomium inaequale]